jgi:ribosomal protein L18
VKATRDAFRDEALGPALDEAMRRSGDRAPLFDKLRRASGLPGPRLNLGLVRAFASEAARRGGEVDALLASMLTLHEDVAPYGHVDEVLPILAAAAIGQRAAEDAKARRPLMELLEEAACDRTRFRIRETVSHALVDIALAVGRSFEGDLRRWAEDDQPWLGLAVATALADDDLLTTIGAEGACGVLDVLLDRLEREHRAGRRHDAFRRLFKGLETTTPAVVARFPQAIDMLIAQAAKSDEDVRAVLAATVTALRKGRFSDKAVALDEALTKSAKPLRDPRHGRLPGKRGRGKH